MHSLLESYLSEVAAHLSPLPMERSREETREMRAHLESVYAAHRQQGQTKDEAAQEAVAQFGAPEAVGRDTVAAWRRGRRMDGRSFWGAAALALALTYLPNLPGRVVHLAGPSLLRLTHRGQFEMWQFELGVVLLLLPSYFGCGALCQFAFPRRAVAGTALTEACLILLFVDSNLGFLGREIVSETGLACLYMAEWVLCPLAAVLGAWAVGRWRRRHHAQPA